MIIIGVILTLGIIFGIKYFISSSGGDGLEATSGNAADPFTAQPAASPTPPGYNPARRTESLGGGGSLEMFEKTNAGYAKVRAFFVKYQDRLLYGTDLTAEPPNPSERAQNPPSNGQPFAKEADNFWRSDWNYLATSGRQRIDAIGAEVKGLALPKPVIDKIYYINARREFGLTRH